MRRFVKLISALFFTAASVFCIYGISTAFGNVKNGAEVLANMTSTKIEDRFIKDFQIKSVEYDYEDVVTCKKTLFGNIDPSIMMAEVQGKIKVGSTLKSISLYSGKWRIIMSKPNITDHQINRKGEWIVDNGIFTGFDNNTQEGKVLEKEKADIEKQVAQKLIDQCIQSNKELVGALLKSYGSSRAYEVSYE